MTLKVGRCGAIPSRVDPRTVKCKAVLSTLTTAQPALRVPPFAYDARPAGNRWRMYGNDVYGCCTFAGIVRIMQNNAKRRGQPFVVDDADVVNAYLDLTNGEDVGAMPINALNYMRNVGIKGHKVLAFARVDDHDVNERQSAMKTFGSLYVAAALPAKLDEDHDLRMELTPKEKRTKNDEPASLGRHAYASFGYQNGEEFTVMWNQENIEEMDWINYYREENWAFIDNGEIDQALLDAMQAQLSAIKAS